MIANPNGTMTLEAAEHGSARARDLHAEELGWGARCRTTRWSVVLAAAAGGTPARAALSRLYRAYWYPLFAAVAKARGREAATELTQQFLFSSWIERGDLSRISQRPGERFRGWLFTALRSFLKNQARHERSQCRDVRRTVALACDADEGELGSHRLVSGLADTKPDPEQRLGREQALSLLAGVLHRLRHEYCVKASAAGVDGERRFEAVKIFLPGPNAERADYREVARALGLTPDTVKQLVCRLRGRFGQLLHDELAKNERCAGDVATAKRLLCQALSVEAGPDTVTANRSGV